MFFQNMKYYLYDPEAKMVYYIACIVGLQSSINFQPIKHRTQITRVRQPFNESNDIATSFHSDTPVYSPLHALTYDRISKSVSRNGITGHKKKNPVFAIIYDTRTRTRAQITHVVYTAADGQTKKKIGLEPPRILF